MAEFLSGRMILTSLTRSFRLVPLPGVVTSTNMRVVDLGKLLQHLLVDPLEDDVLAEINEDDLKKLLEAGYNNKEFIKCASRQGLASTGLLPGKVDMLFGRIRKIREGARASDHDTTTYSEVAKLCRKFVGRTEQHGSVTVVTERLLATYCHGDHSAWVSGAVIKVLFESNEVACKVLTKI